MGFSGFWISLDCNIYGKGRIEDGGSTICCSSVVGSFSTISSSGVLCYEGEGGVFTHSSGSFVGHVTILPECKFN